jgi:hypothetical protein
MMDRVGYSRRFATIFLFPPCNGLIDSRQFLADKDPHVKGKKA